MVPDHTYNLSVFEITSICCSQAPLVDDADVKQYLLQGNILDLVAMRTYKITRPYQLKNSVHSLKYSSLGGSTSFCVIRGLCNPSQSTSHDDVKMFHIILDKITGQPYGGYCTCTVGWVKYHSKVKNLNNVWIILNSSPHAFVLYESFVHNNPCWICCYLLFYVLLLVHSILFIKNNKNACIKSLSKVTTFL